MATVITIGGSPVSAPRTIVPRRLVLYRKGGPASFAFTARGGALPTSGDPYTGKSVTVTIDGTLRFSGEVVSLEPEYVGGIGWVRSYQCLDLRYMGDWVPHTDSNNGSDRSAYNVALDNQGSEYIAARAGRTVGEILEDVLTMVDNANALDAVGIGAYTGLPTTPALPSATTTDLAALTWIPPGPCYFGGEKLLSALESFLATWAPTHVLWVKPDGTIRFLNLRAFTDHTLTWGSDPVIPSGISRDTTECASHVTVRGTQIAEMFNFTTLDQLSEDPFAHDGLTVAQAKAAWTPKDWRAPGLVVGAAGDDNGTCTCPSTTTVEVTSANASQTWTTNYWDQTSTGRQGQLYLCYSAGTTITTYATRAIVSNTSLSAGGTSTLTLDRAIPHLLFDTYTITGLVGGSSAVWVVYELPAWAAAKVARESTYPAPFRATATAAQQVTSTATGTVLWSSSGDPPYEQVSTPIVVDPITGYVHFPYPTFLTAGGKPPSIVRAMVPIYTGTNLVESPPDVSSVRQYDGTYYTVEGRERVLTVTVPAWRDPANAPNMQDYADNLLDSVKDTVQEGMVTYRGTYATAFEMGHALSIASADGFTTGWESVALPIVECELAWGVLAGEALNRTTTMRCSNRMAHFSADQFLKPDRTGVTFDFGGELDIAAFGTTVFNAGAALGAFSISDLPTNVAGLVAGNNPAAFLDMSNPIDTMPNPGQGTLGGLEGGMPFIPDMPLGNALAGGGTREGPTPDHLPNTALRRGDPGRGAATEPSERQKQARAAADAERAEIERRNAQHGNELEAVRFAGQDKGIQREDQKRAEANRAREARLAREAADRKAIEDRKARSEGRALDNPDPQGFME